MVDGFLLRITLAAVGVALVAGPLGCFVLWRRMVYFGDTLSHSALLGVSFAIALDLPPVLGVLLVGFAISALILSGDRQFHHVDTLLGVSAHATLAMGLVAVSLSQGGDSDLLRYLVGDILTANGQDVALIWAGGLLCVGILLWRWTPLLMSSLDAELARAHGHDPRQEAVLFTFALAILIAIAIKVVGALMITALLIIPAATARLLASTPEKMAAIAALAGGLAAVGGLYGSFRLDTPTGPSIVLASLGLLILAAAARAVFARA